VNPEPFLQLDRVIHERGRLAIMSMLAASPELSFTELRDTLEMTDGNLTTHMRTLQEAGYVSIAKSYRNRRPLTTVSLTAAGRQAFASYVALLEQIVQQTKRR
jgi:DNA-binding MarR family transcriptional regulator